MENRPHETKKCKIIGRYVTCLMSGICQFQEYSDWSDHEKQTILNVHTAEKDLECPVLKRVLSIA